MPARRQRRIDHAKLKAEKLIQTALELVDDKEELDAIAQHFADQLNAAWERVTSQVDGGASERDITTAR